MSIMKTGVGATLVVLLAAATATAQSPPSAFKTSTTLQAPQDPGYAAQIAKCNTPLPTRAAGPAPAAPAAAPTAQPAEPPFPALIPPPSAAIPGILAAGQSWKSVWQWAGNNIDGPIPTDRGTILEANNDAGTVMEIYPDTGQARIVYDKLNAPGAVGRSKTGALFVAERGLGARITQLEPTRKVLADSYQGGPLECIGGILNDIVVDAHGGVYASAGGTVAYANPKGVVSVYGTVTRSNGIVLSPDEKVLYVTNGPTLVAFDVQADGALTNQRDFATFKTVRNGDGTAVDEMGRIYVGGGGNVDIFSPKGEFLGAIAGPVGLHGVFFGGPSKKTLYGILLYGQAPNRHNQIVALPLEATGYMGRAK